MRDEEFGQEQITNGRAVGIAEYCRSGNRSPHPIYRFHPKSRGYEGEEKSHNLDKVVLDLVRDAEEVRDSARAHPSRFWWEKRRNYKLYGSKEREI
jgi:hypothetical protein